MVDFARLNHIKHVIETDYDVRARREVASEAICVLRYNGVMAQILGMPVPVRDEPVAVAGEIDSSAARKRQQERKADMSWNQGNGYNGGADDVYNRMNNAREQGGARFPFIDEGRHKLALVTLEKFNHNTDGPSARAIFKVLESNKHPVGSFVVKIYKLVKPTKYPTSASDAELLAQMCIALKDAPRGYPIGNDIRVLLEERPAEQLARGTMVEVTGVPNQKKNWVNLYWKPVQQSPEQIVQMRQQIEREGVPDTGSGNQARQQYGQPQGNVAYPNAPHAAAQPQYAPPAQPAYQPAVPQQQYAAPAAAPQGGFLAQLPPQGGNGGGRPW